MLHEAQAAHALARFLGLVPPTGALWGFHVSWSTTNPPDWVVQRNRLRPDDVRFTLSLCQSYWTAKLERRDESYKVIWNGQDPRVDSAQLRYRVLTPWPPLIAPVDAPRLACDLGTLLGRDFQRDVNLDGSLVDQVLQSGFDDAPLRHWLKPSADEWQVFGKRR